MAGDTDFSIDLAKYAVADCLSKSKHVPADIDLLIFCSISRYDGPGFRLSFEPSSSIKLRNHFDFGNATVFDITNACAGMFTGIYIVDSFIKARAIRCGMVVSGEYITPLTQTAQKEIKSFMDTRLACLTLGDAGAALILEEGPNSEVGFHDIDLHTMGQYSHYCTAKATEEVHGGMIMYTDSVNLTDVAMKTGASHTLQMLQNAEWPSANFQHLIMHQTSRMTMDSARKEINRLLKGNICHDGNTINNVTHRGNTASTTHFVAVADNILNNKIKSGDRTVFSITASGLTIGTALYTFDDLPDRLRGMESQQSSSQKVNATQSGRSGPVPSRLRLRIESLGTISEPDGEMNSEQLLKLAATSCLEKSSHQRSDLGLLIYSGVYRTGYVVEPAYAALLAGELDINASMDSRNGKKTLAFDIFNGAVGVLNACSVALQMIRANKCKNALIVAAEIENNARSFPGELLGIRETASAFIVDGNQPDHTGFSSFHFRYDTAAMNAYTSYLTTKNEKPYLHIEKSAHLESLYIASILPAIRELLSKEGLEMAQINKIFPPQISSTFISRLSEAMSVPQDKFVNAVHDGPDLFSSSLPYALQYAYEHDLVKPGDIGLIIAVGSGIQTGCGIYHF